MKKNIGVDWGSDDVDTFKAGDPSTIVTGVVTTSMATLDVLQKAVQAGANLIITAAPTFYSKADLSTPAGRGFGAGGAGRGQAPARGAGPGAAPAPSPATVSGPGTGASAPMPPAPAMPQSVVPPGQPPAAAASGDATAARSGLRGQERLHREAQAGGVPPDAALESAQAGPARARARGGDGLDEIQESATTRFVTTCPASRSRRSPAN